jgi:L-2-hydroxyglutarate oxidase LhgO
LTKSTVQFDLAIIGAGVIGLAIAAELTDRHPGRSIVLLEQHESFGRETSSRNSEIIHAGIYYPTGSLKAKLSVEGKELLYNFCTRYMIPHRRIGKLIVANSQEEEESLDALQRQALANGVTDLQLLDAGQVKSLEPQVRAQCAIFSPSTGIFDSNSLMARLEFLACQNGVLPAYCHRLTAVEKTAGGFLLTLELPDGKLDRLETSIVVNCAGLAADRIAAQAGIDIDQAGYRQRPCKGEYFSLPPAKAALVNHLVYPPPLANLAGLGIHATKTIDGRLRLGPNTIYTDQTEDYSIDSAHATDFYHSVKPFMPFVTEEDLEPEMAGFRPKLSGPGEPVRDFLIREESDRDLPGLINLIGIESPGLTACLGIARLVASLI